MGGLVSRSLLIQQSYFDRFLLPMLSLLLLLALMDFVATGPLITIPYMVESGSRLYQCRCTSCSPSFGSIACNEENLNLLSNINLLCKCLADSCYCDPMQSLNKRSPGIEECFSPFEADGEGNGIFGEGKSPFDEDGDGIPDWGGEVIESSSQPVIKYKHPRSLGYHLPEGCPMIKLNEKQQLSFESYKQFTKSFWKAEALKENPLLMEMTPDQAAEVTLLSDKVDPSIKLGPVSKIEWHQRDPSWRNRFWEAAVKLRDHIAKKQESQEPGFSSQQEFLDILGQWRNFVKLESNMLTEMNNPEFQKLPDEEKVSNLFDEEARAFGSEQYVHVTTPVGGRYANLAVDSSGTTAREFVETKLQNYKFAKDIDLKSGDTNLPEISIVADEQDSNVYNLKFKIGKDEFMPLTYDYPPHWKVYNPLTSFRSKGDIQTLFLESINALFKEGAVDLEAYSEKVGKVHWMIGNFSPFARGSAAIADLMTATAYLSKGYQFPGWKVGVSADVTALCMPDLKLYMSQFQSMMDGESPLEI